MGASDDVKVIGMWSSPFVMRPRIALNLKSVRYEFLEEKSTLEKSELLVKSNPVHKKIPVLIHGDRPVCESLVILEYIDEVWSSGKAILPEDPYECAVARFWAAYIDDKWFPWLRGAVQALEDEKARKECLAQVYDGLIVLEGAFEKCSKGKPLFGGDQVGYLDIVLGSFLGWIRVAEEINEIKLLGNEKTRGLAGWAEKFVADEAAKEVIPDREKMMKYAKTLFARWKREAMNLNLNLK